MRKFAVRVNEETVNFIERLAYEVEGMKAIVKEIISDAQTNPLVLEGEGFKAYNAKYEERNAKYEIAKQELQDQYIPRQLSESNKIMSWKLDYKSGVLEFIVVDDSYEPEGDNIAEV